MLQIGVEDPTGEYETAYIDVKSLISTHVFKGAKGTPLTPQVVSEAEVKDALRAGYKSPFFGKLVTLKKGTDYTVKYENNVEKGTATVTVTGKGNYTGTIIKNFTIE